MVREGFLSLNAKDRKTPRIFKFLLVSLVLSLSLLITGSLLKGTSPDIGRWLCSLSTIFYRFWMVFEWGVIS
ncbi:hypothetical protein QBC46DRAFT_398517 [Diplogelasinospora grovesii]|uniref:Uncharacterized protein n=1 Tax=Diplogelasinospora grovesii TaxID=303347 RepID=A0AAN6RZY9_9PEZI|nr:hypothetical protein QBC46DRAFT_398517 [Diplogelasinospora grovesii]